jgi:NAD(P)-dependent dehydrogenase (short-subunit alcohol dehydrogenase family)
MHDLRGSVVLVTGGAHRLGRAIALGFAQAGADVIIHYHSSGAKAGATLAELRGLGVRAAALQADLSRVEEAERLGDQALGQWGRLDVLVNSSGVWGATPVGSTAQEQWDQFLNLNLRGAFFLTQRAAPALRAARGAVVNIADVGALRPWRNHTPYLVSKGGLVTMTEALAKDLAPEVRVNAIAPGPVLLPDDWDEQRAESSKKTVLLRRLGTPEDVAHAAVFLAQASYITGAVLPVDGGNRLI